MELKLLNATGVQIPEVGFGTWNYRGDPKIIHRCIEVGSSLIDTAEIYETESYIGAAIQGVRDRVILATKVSGEHLHYKDVLIAADSSLLKLGTDFIDLYQVHWYNTKVPIEETMGALETLVEAGKVRFVGVSNFKVHQLEEAQEGFKYKIVSNQVLYNLLNREVGDALLPYCEKNLITLIAFRPLAQGLLHSKIQGRKRLVDTLERISNENGKSHAQIAINWCTYNPMVITIPRSNQIRHVEENAKASGWRLTPEQYRELNAASQ